jgi:hypothetical protein
MKDSIRYGYHLGFQPFQLSLWTTVSYQIHQKSIEMIISNEFDRDGWISMAESVLSDYQGNCEFCPKPSLVFSKSELQHLVSYLVQGYIQHMHLYRHVFAHHQDQEIRLRKVWIDQSSQIVESMKLAVKASEWEEHCKVQKEKAEIERQNAKALETKRIAEERALADQEERERHTLLLKQRVGISNLRS